jgi:hypothetical protein
MMTNPAQWWRNKTQHKRQNWCLLALAVVMIAGTTVEALSYWALIGAVPGLVLGWLEVLR